MREISLKESDISRLKEFPLDGIISSESKIYYYKKDKDWSSILLKRLYRTEEKRVDRKVKTIEEMQQSELASYKELVLPENIVSIGGVKSGFTIKEVTNSRNLHLLLEDRAIPNSKKIEILRKIGELLRRVDSQNQEFYFGDLQDYNFLVDQEEKIYAIDLDSAATTRKKPLETKYISIDKKTHSINKYKVNKAGRAYPSRDIDIFCYNTMVLNFLAGVPLHRLTYDEYYNYLEYLESLEYPRGMLETYRNHYTNKRNESVVDYLEEVPVSIERGSYKVYQALQKLK